MSSIFSKPDPPTPPNPMDTARAQTGTNVSTAVANAYLGNVNQQTPGGSLTYSPGQSYSWSDPSTGQTYSVPTFTATQTLSPQLQAIQDQQLATQFNLGSMANAQSGRISNLLGSAMDPSFNAAGYLAANPDVANAARAAGIDPMQFAAQHYAYNLRNEGGGRTGWQAPTAGNVNAISGIPGAATSYDRGGPIQSQLGPLDAITKTYGPEDNFSADRQRVEESLMARMNPQLQIEQQRLQQQLADQGIRYGSQAYTDAMENYSRQANDARFAAIAQGGQEQQRMNQMAAQLAAFQNQAQGQGYEQALGQAGLANQAQQQGYQQNALLAQFGNAGLAQQLQQQQMAFNAAQAARNQYMQEQYAQRNQPINEITSLLSGSQVQQPNFVNTPGAQIPTTDIAGLLNQNFNQQLGVYSQQSQNANQLLGGILGLGAGALKASDERVKENVSRIGTVFAAGPEHERKKLPIYQYSYKQDPDSARHTGPMAQDVEKVDPGAVKTIDGIKHIRTHRVMGDILRAG